MKVISAQVALVQVKTEEKLHTISKTKRRSECKETAKICPKVNATFALRLQRLREELKTSRKLRSYGAYGGAASTRHILGLNYKAG